MLQLYCCDCQLSWQKVNEKTRTILEIWIFVEKSFESWLSVYVLQTL